MENEICKSKLEEIQQLFHKIVTSSALSRRETTLCRTQGNKELIDTKNHNPVENKSNNLTKALTF